VLAAAGDIACDPDDPSYNGGEGTATACRQKHVSDLLTGADVVLPLGDNQYDEATLAQFNAVFGPTWGRFKAFMHPAIGNHEYFTAGAAGYFDYFNGPVNASGPAGERGKGYYSFDVGGWHLVALNSNCSEVGCATGSPQETWLRSDLAAHPASCTLAFWHHPRFSSALSASVHWAEEPRVSPLWKALADAGAELVLTGHAHQYERFAPQRLDPVNPESAAGVPDPNGLRQFVVGTGGEEHHPFGTGGTYATSEVRDATHFGVLEMVLHPGSYEWDFVGEDGASLDDGEATCH
jgi:hypothetical protein